MTARLQEAPTFAGHSPGQERPLGGYAILTSAFAGACTAFGLWLRRSGRGLPERIDGRDIALIAVATHKSSRLLAKDRVTSTVRAPFTRFQDDAGAGEVDEAARGHGLRRAVGELLICPYCLGMWISTFLTAGLIAAPRATRAVMVVFAAVFGSDVLQLAYARAIKATRS